MNVDGSISATCQTMTCEGDKTECYDNSGTMPGVCRCLVGYISETEVSTNTDCEGKYLLIREYGKVDGKGKINRLY